MKDVGFNGPYLSVFILQVDSLPRLRMHSVIRNRYILVLVNAEDVDIVTDRRDPALRFDIISEMQRTVTIILNKAHFVLLSEIPRMAVRELFSNVGEIEPDRRDLLFRIILTVLNRERRLPVKIPVKGADADAGGNSRKDLG